jgi:hypothetical protein
MVGVAAGWQWHSGRQGRRARAGGRAQVFTEMWSGWAQMRRDKIHPIYEGRLEAVIG